MKYRFTTLCLITIFSIVGNAPVLAQTNHVDELKTTGPSLDCAIEYYNRVLTPEGVTRESRYEEKMIRRSGHVWLSRTLPTIFEHQEEAHDHKHFNPVTIPRYISLVSDQVKIEFADPEDKYLISIDPSEYENVNFDGSWSNAYFIAPPHLVTAMPKTARKSTIDSAYWHETEKDGVFHRVLWDEKNMIPRVIESGDRKNTFFSRIEVKLSKTKTQKLPWNYLQGYSQKEYADFLD